MADYAGMLEKALGGKWRIVYDGSCRWRWALTCGGLDFCSTARRGDLLRAFVKAAREEIRCRSRWTDTGRLVYPIRDFLACGSVSELKLKLEACGG